MPYTEVPNILRCFCFRLGLSLAVLAGSVYAGGPEDRSQQAVRVVRADPRTGKLVRSVVVTSKPMGTRKIAGAAVNPPLGSATVARPLPAPEPHPSQFNEAVQSIAASQSLPPQLVHSVIKVESNYNPLAVSTKGAQGLMQLMPETARRFGVANAFDPVDNIQGGTRYLKYLLDLYNGDYRLALAAYNAGEGAVQKYGTVPPYPETQDYLTRVGQQIQKSVAAAPPLAESRPAAPKAAEDQPAGPARIQEVVASDGSVRYISR